MKKSLEQTLTGVNSAVSDFDRHFGSTNNVRQVKEAYQNADKNNFALN